METAHSWLLKNGYEDVAGLIDEIRQEWKLAGKKTRRNWWDKLCGGKNGNPTKIGTHVIPVLRAAQIRKGWPVTENALCRNEDEQVPEILTNTRWSQR